MILMSADERINAEGIITEDLLNNLKESEEELKDALGDEYVESLEAGSEEENDDENSTNEDSVNNDNKEFTEEDAKEMISKCDANNIPFYKNAILNKISNYEKILNDESKSDKEKELAKVYIDTYKKEVEMIDTLLIGDKNPMLSYNQYGKYKKEKVQHCLISLFNKMNDNKNYTFIDPRLLEYTIHKVFTDENEANIIIMKVLMYLDRVSMKDPIDVLYMYLMELIVFGISNDNFKRKDEVIEMLKKLL